MRGHVDLYDVGPMRGRADLYNIRSVTFSFFDYYCLSVDRIGTPSVSPKENASATRARGEAITHYAGLSNGRDYEQEYSGGVCDHYGHSTQSAHSGKVRVSFFSNCDTPFFFLFFLLLISLTRLRFLHLRHRPNLRRRVYD